MKTIRVLQVVDTLNANGQSRVAVNIANLLQSSGFQSYICTTRMGGSLLQEVGEKVGILSLGRISRLDIGALSKFIAFIRANPIDIVHAHGASLFLSSLASLFPPYPLVIWHDHYGSFARNPRPLWAYRLGTRLVKGVITCSEPLSEWVRQDLQVPAKRVWYLPNFVKTSNDVGKSPILPGSPGARIVCVANLRPVKDHSTLFRAMKLILQTTSEAHLLLIGKPETPDDLGLIQKEIKDLGLEDKVSLLGERKDVQAILQASDVGVLSSVVEAFPLVLLEYGMAGLPVVASKVGQCAEILDQGRAGIHVPPGSPPLFAEALSTLLQSSSLCKELGNRHKNRVMECYNPQQFLNKLLLIYDAVLGKESVC